MTPYLKMMFILFILMNFLFIQQSSAIESRSKDIRITPNDIIMNSTGIKKVVCINYQATNLPLEVKIAESIPLSQVKLNILSSNISTLNMQLEVNNYIGYFHLLCYEKGNQVYGNSADIHTIADPGTLKRADFCEVFEKQYITCKIFARNIATAIMNGYEQRFRFNETNHPFDRPAYIQPPEFLKNQSTNEYLVFKWRPTVAEVFPRGVWMYMQQFLKHFTPTDYFFEIIPVHRITPKFILENLSSSKMQINLAPTSPPAYCEKSILPLLNRPMNKTWTPIESGKDNIKIENLIPNTIYRVCIKCQAVSTDPAGLEVCQESKTPSSNIYWISFVVFSTVVLLIIFVVIVSLWIKRRINRDRVVVIGKPKTFRISNTYVSDTQSISPSDDHNPVQVDDESPATSLLNTHESVDDGEGKYQPMVASIPDVIEASSPSRTFS